MDGSSEIARAFGAKVNMTWQTDGLYLVRGRSDSPAGLVQSHEGKVAVALGPRTVLAAMPFSSYLEFRGHAAIEFIGPVSVDPVRFEQFVKLIAQSQPG